LSDKGFEEVRHDATLVLVPVELPERGTVDSARLQELPKVVLVVVDNGECFLERYDCVRGKALRHAVLLLSFLRARSAL